MALLVTHTTLLEISCTGLNPVTQIGKTFIIQFKAKKKRGLFLGSFFKKNRCGRAAFYFNFYSAENRCRNFFIEEIPEMESRINKLANITGNGPQRPSETTWSLPIMMLRNWKSVFFSFSFLESNKKK